MLMYYIRHTFEYLLNPFTFIFLLLMLATFSYWICRSTKLSKGTLTLTFSYFLVFSTGFFPCMLTTYLENQHPIVTEVDHDIHYVVVLGGGQVRDNAGISSQMLTNVSIKRLLEGIRVYRELKDAKLIFSGGRLRDEVTEAKRMRDIAIENGIKPQDIILEDKSINTRDEALLVKKIVGDKKVYLVTSAIHMPRSMALFAKAGVNALAAPTDFTYFWRDDRLFGYYLPNPANLLYTSIAWHEILGMLYAKLRNEVI